MFLLPHFTQTFGLRIALFILSISHPFRPCDFAFCPVVANLICAFQLSAHPVPNLFPLGWIFVIHKHPPITIHRRKLRLRKPLPLLLGRHPTILMLPPLELKPVSGVGICKSQYKVIFGSGWKFVFPVLFRRHRAGGVFGHGFSYERAGRLLTTGFPFTSLSRNVSSDCE